MATDLIINASLPETRIALLENGEIQELHIERDSERGIVGNIYKGRVIRVLPGMQAAFVDIGLEKAAFLYVDDIFFPDMKTPLVGQPLPEPIQKPVVKENLSQIVQQGRRRGGRIQQKIEPVVRNVTPGSPEEHAMMQREYAKQMLDLEQELEADGDLVSPRKPEESVTAAGIANSLIEDARTADSSNIEDARTADSSDIEDALAGASKLGRSSPTADSSLQEVSSNSDSSDPTTDTLGSEQGIVSPVPKKNPISISAILGKLSGHRNSKKPADSSVIEDARTADSSIIEDAPIADENPVVVSVQADPKSLEFSDQQPEARSPSSDFEESELEGESELESTEADPSLVYRPEPLIDAEAWAEDVVEARVGSEVGETSIETENQESIKGELVTHPLMVDTGEVEEEFVDETQAEDSQNLGLKEESIATGLSDAPSEDASAKPVSVISNLKPPVAPLVREKAAPVRENRRVIKVNDQGSSALNDDADESSDDEESEEMPRRRRRREAVNIADLVKEGQEILVQVAKDPIGTKGARLTCHVSLPGRYLVFMPTVDHIGVSRRIESEAERRRLKETMSKVRPPKTGVIVRTASGKQTDKKLKADLDYLVATWNDIQKKFNKQRTPSPVYQDLTIVLRAIRDMFTDEVDRVVVDSKREHKAIMKFVTRFIPSVKDKVELYNGEMPIFDAYGIETEISKALERKVWLKSGGYLVIDQAEALVAIDVNTGRYVGKKNLEETILKTNLEAVKEIAYQLRMRNCGGIIILDLIDMEKEASREKVYKALEEALKKDRARPTILKISSLGLIEMTRKRTRDSLVRSLCEPCSYCEGKSFVKSKFTTAYDILRDIEREGVEKDTQGISIQCHPSVADVLLEDKRDVIEDLERHFNKKITARGNGAYHVEQYELVAHRDAKNIVWSSEERKQLLRNRIQERSQQLAAENRKQIEQERAEKKKEAQQASKEAKASTGERRRPADKRKGGQKSSKGRDQNFERRKLPLNKTVISLEGGQASVTERTESEMVSDPSEEPIGQQHVASTAEDVSEKRPETVSTAPVTDEYFDDEPQPLVTPDGKPIVGAAGVGNRRVPQITVRPNPVVTERGERGDRSGRNSRRRRRGRRPAFNNPRRGPVIAGALPQPMNLQGQLHDRETLTVAPVASTSPIAPVHQGDTDDHEDNIGNIGPRQGNLNLGAPETAESDPSRQRKRRGRRGGRHRRFGAAAPRGTNLQRRRLPGQAAKLEQGFEGDSSSGDDRAVYTQSSRGNQGDEGSGSGGGTEE